MDGYEQLKVIGRGASGNVYLARRLSDGLQCVQKSIIIDGLDEKERKETKMEVKVLKMLHHPFITAYYDSQTTDRAIHIIMEFAEGGTLRQMVNQCSQKKESLSEDTALDWIIQIGIALKFCHDKGILHRDLKSDNVFLSKDKAIVKLGDFGLAKVLSSQTRFATTILGTPYYMSPEVCSQSHYGAKNDVWAMGVLLYELLALKRPFTAESIGPLIIRIMKGVYEPLPDRCSDGVKELVSRMLTTDVEERISLDELMVHPFVRDRVDRWRDYAREEEEEGEQSWADATAELSPRTVEYIQKGSPVSNPIEVITERLDGTGHKSGPDDTDSTQAAKPRVPRRPDSPAGMVPSPPAGPRPPRVGSGGRRRPSLGRRSPTGGGQSPDASEGTDGGASHLATRDSTAEPTPNTSATLTNTSRSSSPTIHQSSGMEKSHGSTSSFEGSKYSILTQIPNISQQGKIPPGNRQHEVLKMESGKPPISPHGTGQRRPSVGSSGGAIHRKSSIGSAGSDTTASTEMHTSEQHPPIVKSPRSPRKSPSRVSFQKPSLQFLASVGSHGSAPSSAREGHHSRFGSMQGMHGKAGHRRKTSRVRSAPLKPSHNVRVVDSTAETSGDREVVQTPHRRYNRLEPLKNRPSSAPIMIQDKESWLDDPTQWP